MSTLDARGGARAERPISGMALTEVAPVVFARLGFVGVAEATGLVHHEDDAGARHPTEGGGALRGVVVGR
jgi:hypothetical protein